MDQDKNEQLIVIPYANIKGIIGEPNKLIEYEFNNPIFKHIVNNSPTKYVLLSSNFKSTKHSSLIAIKAELMATEVIKNSSSDENTVLKLKIIEIVTINTSTIRHLDEQIGMAHYSAMCSSPDFASIKNDVEKVILGIRYIEDEHMPNLPEFDPKSNTESLEQYSYRLSFFIISIVSKLVEIDNLEDFFKGNVLTILRKARYALLQYLKAKEQQNPTFQRKLLTGEILY